MSEVALEEMNRTKPSLPSELLQFSLDDIDILDFPRQLDELWEGVLRELCDIKYTSMAHNISTYNRGCRGPLCIKARREDARRKQSIEETAEDRTYRHLGPITEYYATIARLRLRNHRLARLMAIKAG